MNRHEECIFDGCEKLKLLAQMLGDHLNANISGVSMGLHVYNVLLLINGENANKLVQPDAVDEAGPFLWSGYLCEIDKENHNAMPVFQFEKRVP